MVTHKTVPIAVRVRTPWGAVELQPITFPLMPGRDNVVLFGMAMMKELGIDLYPLALDNYARMLCRCKPAWKTPAILLRGV
ncbi:unnamed protein product [Sphacelaria rigidula]